MMSSDTSWRMCADGVCARSGEFPDNAGAVIRAKEDTLGVGMTSRRTRERLVVRLRNGGISDASVLAAIRDTPRHLFVDEALASRAYEDTALPIGAGQSISQPYVVARATDALLEEKRLGRVLEIGCGCGYQAAVLSGLVSMVYGVERIASLVFRAREHLHRLGIGNVRIRHGDGAFGWPEHAPYDGIIVSAASEAVPRDLLEQLAPGARLVIPLGNDRSQTLVCIQRTEFGFERRELEPVRFVPMIGGTG